MNYYFIGICGTAMASLAVALKNNGDNVIGSDSEIYPPMSDFLINNNIKVFRHYNEDNILKNKDNIDLVVIGNAISRGNPEVEEVLNSGLLYSSLPEVLKNNFLHKKKNYVVTGTHGKTTTTSILAWIFEKCGKNPNYLIGGLPKNFKHGARFGNSEITILEGDEYDTSFFDKRSKFVHYLPEVLIINNIEFDHSDIFRDLDDIKLSFRRLLNIVPKNGVVFMNGDDKNCRDIAENSLAPVIFVGFSENNDIRIESAEYFSDNNYFTLFDQEFKLPLSGEYNNRNAAMAISAAEFSGISVSDISNALSSFEGISRRQELYGEVSGIKIYDDFAHHPSAISQSISAIRQRNDNKKIWVLFEPRSNTMRTKIFQNELPDSLGVADGVIISNIDNVNKISKDNRLDIDLVINTLIKRGADAYKTSNNKEVIKLLNDKLSSGDIILILSNGNFSDLKKDLLAQISIS